MAGARLLPIDVAWVETTVERAYVDLFATERATASCYAPLRYAEFATGRACARDALAALGLPRAAIPPGPAGDPVWPPGAVGSITHCPGYRAAAVARASSYEAIGIDAERHLALPADVLHAVAGPGELAGLAMLPPDGTAWDRILFSAKESAYKAWFPLVRGEVLADGIVVRLEPGGVFDAVIEDRRLQGRWTVTPTHVLTAVPVARRACVSPTRLQL